MALILLSGYSTSFLISSSVGILSSAYFLPLGSPRVIFFYGILPNVQLISSFSLLAKVLAFSSKVVPGIPVKSKNLATLV
jgi:hypothetical protein